MPTRNANPRTPWVARVSAKGERYSLGVYLSRRKALDKELEFQALVQDNPDIRQAEIEQLAKDMAALAKRERDDLLTATTDINRYTAKLTLINEIIDRYTNRREQLLESIQRLTDLEHKNAEYKQQDEAQEQVAKETSAEEANPATPGRVHRARPRVKANDRYRRYNLGDFTNKDDYDRVMAEFKEQYTDNHRENLNLAFRIRQRELAAQGKRARRKF